MPRFRKLSPVEVLAQDQPAPGPRAHVAREYDDYLAGFAIGDYGRAELHDGERRDMVRTRLHAAARRRGLALRFRPGPGATMIFCVIAPAPAPTEVPVGAPLVGARRDPTPRRSPRRRQTATERYHEVLPRWMRGGRQGGRRAGSKQRAR
jgi:hypothetical protein